MAKGTAEYKCLKEGFFLLRLLLCISGKCKVVQYFPYFFACVIIGERGNSRGSSVELLLFRISPICFLLRFPPLLNGDKKDCFDSGGEWRNGIYQMQRQISFFNVLITMYIMPAKLKYVVNLVWRFLNIFPFFLRTVHKHTKVDTYYTYTSRPLSSSLLSL